MPVYIVIREKKECGFGWVGKWRGQVAGGEALIYFQVKKFYKSGDDMEA